MKKLWIVGRVVAYEFNGWEFQGVFDSEEKAINVCKDSSYFIGPAFLNSKIPHASCEWKGARYPIEE